jgi:hypothetical protein
MSINRLDSMATGSVRDSASVALAKTGKAEQPKKYDAAKVEKAFEKIFTYSKPLYPYSLTTTDHLTICYDRKCNSAVRFEFKGNTVTLEGIANIDLKTGAITSRDIIGSDKHINPSDKGYADIVNNIKIQLFGSLDNAYEVMAEGGLVVARGSDDMKDLFRKFANVLDLMK